VPERQPVGAGSDEPVLLAEEHREVLAALGGLGRRQREVLVLRYWSDLSEADIAETLGISRGTVKSTASRALTALQKALAGEAP
jgi:RNA polymerase sigma factor (sigma-70 family)